MHACCMAMTCPFDFKLEIIGAEGWALHPVSIEVERSQITGDAARTVAMLHCMLLDCSTHD